MPEHPAAVEWSAAEREAVEQALTTPEMPALTDYGMVPVRIDSAAFTRAALDALAPFVAERERQAAARALREAVEDDYVARLPGVYYWLRHRADRIERGEP